MGEEAGMKAAFNAYLDRKGVRLELEEPQDSDMDWKTMAVEILRVDCSENHNCNSHRTNSG